MAYNKKIVLREDWSFNNVQYYKGDVFKIIGDSFRGWDLQSERTKNKIYECLFVHDKFDYYNIKQERKEKLLNILKNQ